MESLSIEKTHRTPKINFDVSTGLMEISGRSIPENSIMFYKPVFDWLDQYRIESQNTSIHIMFKLDYFNTSSSKCILDIFRKLESYREKGKTVHVQWFYDPRDEDMEDAGKDFRDIVDLEFEMVEMQTNN